MHKGKPSIINVDVGAQLYDYFEAIRAADRVVTIAMLVLEYYKLDDSIVNIKFRTIYQRVRRWLRTKHLRLRRSTYVDQNTVVDIVMIEAFRFHINPELNVVKTMSGNAALIQISKNKSLLFSINSENVELEKSIFLGEKKIIDSTCITISGNLVNKNKTFNWEIRKNI